MNEKSHKYISDKLEQRKPQTNKKKKKRKKMVIQGIAIEQAPANVL